ncbi:MAG TPA: RagB/SusD family nutrient uptake outer membrane protein, partial [Flavitalea sp.]|nr:RagB/SusD family nutrient uptake outer membrane protein [Flavitalea sp.]
MKRLFKTLLSLIIILVLVSGCKKILEVTPQSSITEEIYFKNEGDFEPYVTGIYTFIRTFQNNFTYGMERGEELISASNSRFTVAWTHTLSPTSGAVNYDAWYRAIGNCNLLLARIKDFPFTINPDSKDRIMAETYALRAYFYFNLTRVIKDAPLMLSAVVDENVELLPRSPAVQVAAQIVSDLDSASLLFKANPSFSPASYPSKYRFAYGSVNAMKADVKMWSGKVLGGGAADFNAAIAAINEVESSGVSLNADFKNVVGLRAPTNPEIIMSAYFNR